MEMGEIGNYFWSLLAGGKSRDKRVHKGEKAMKFFQRASGMLGWTHFSSLDIRSSIAW